MAFQGGSQSEVHFIHDLFVGIDLPQQSRELEVLLKSLIETLQDGFLGSLISISLILLYVNDYLLEIII
jgi:hypothetical protein